MVLNVCEKLVVQQMTKEQVKQRSRVGEVAWEDEMWLKVEKKDRERGLGEWAQSQLCEPGRAVAGDEEVREGGRHVEEGGGHVEEGEEQDGGQAGNEG